ncbi:hypothetical protein LE181_27280 [Streptomyces sp. SCA3-4]|uniref:hypothetical protein n=1 Tax=Streptomyces sichuanensis TaxID=2871810 RepID=UPI001CE3603F|nr:hypothetical protein [Streptomyces sichuanensis]MCA6095852.1 hypothetical protein [Streptomyces sichuanensis]
MSRRKRRIVIDPLGTAMAWLWALGTAGTLVGLGVTVDRDLSHHAAPIVSLPDADPTAA